jgi:kynurenine formamidase
VDANLSEAPPLSAAEFDALYRNLKRTTSWGAHDRRGGLNNITPERLLAAVAEVRLGVTVSLSRPVEANPSADNPEPCGHEMIAPMDGLGAPTGVDFAMDQFDMHVHGNAQSHLDALCHVIYDQTLYNDVPVDSITPAGATELSIDIARDGIVGRGVLLDIPRLRGVPWLEPGEHVTAADLLAAEEAEQVRVGPGDLLFVRVGHLARRDALGPWDASVSRAGLHPTAMEFVAERQVAALGSDSNNDAAPNTTEGVDFPIHVLAVNAIGLHLLDYLQFEELGPLCEQEQRWSFLCVIAPLRLPEATGSPVNPIAIL